MNIAVRESILLKDKNKIDLFLTLQKNYIIIRMNRTDVREKEIA